MIRHSTARRIASEWYDGQWTGLYALCSSGAIVTTFSALPPDPDYDDLPLAIAEIEDSLRWTEANPTAVPPNDYMRDKRDLTALLAYVKHYGPRGPVQGWNAMPW